MDKTFKPILKINKYLLLILTITICCFISSCKKPEPLDNTIALGYKDQTYYLISSDGKTLSLNKYDDVKPVFGEYLMVQKNDKWGFIDLTGKEITKIKYDVVYPMSEDKAVVTYKGKTQIINSKDEVIYTFTDNMTSYSSFKENKLVIEKDGLYGYLEFKDDSFTVLVEPTYNYAASFSEDYAVIGILTENNIIKYTYINTRGEEMTSSFNYDVAYDFSNGFGRIGFKKNTTSSIDMDYQYVKFKDSGIIYLSNSGQVIKSNYATDFMNGLAFTAEYQRYEADTSQKYKWFSFVDVKGNRNYDAQLEDYAKKMPRTFLPQSPVYLNDCLIIQNGNRNRGTWEILYDSVRYYTEKDNTYHEFKPVTWNIDENDEIIKNTVNGLNYSSNLILQYLTTPIELGLFKQNQVLNSYIAKSKITGNKCGLITINYTPFEQTDEYCVDNFIITTNYIVPAIYDEIIY